jgi:hypothetical protein
MTYFTDFTDLKWNDTEAKLNIYYKIDSQSNKLLFFMTLNKKIFFIKLVYLRLWALFQFYDVVIASNIS